MQAKDIMKSELVLIHPDVKIKTAVKKMIENDISGIPVVDGSQKLLGIVTETDILNYGKLQTMPDYLELLETILYRQTPNKYQEELLETLSEEVNSVMNDNVITVSPETPIGEVAVKMTDKDINRVIIVENDRVKGLISRKDILSNILDLIEK
ncbi:MAG: CBS domain-containing protein [Andreesenia angusta]|nr:CBS domain-containing protein [Andreesenia angusta]